MQLAKPLDLAAEEGVGIILPHVVSRMPRYANVHIKLSNSQKQKLVSIIIMASVCRIVKAGSRLILKLD